MRRSFGIALALVALAVIAAPAAAQDVEIPDPPDPATVEHRELLVVDGQGDPLSGGGSATEFGLALEGEDECPGDSTHDQYRIDSYMVPVDADPTQLMFTGFGPADMVFQDYAAFRMPVYMRSGDPYSAQLTSQQLEAGGPGPIPEIPKFGWGVYVATPGIEGYEGGIPAGAYRMGIACTYGGRTTNVWETTIEITDDASDEPVGMTWTVTGPQSAGIADEGSASSANWFVYGLFAFGAVMAVVAVVLHRSSKRSGGGEGDDASREQVLV